MPLTLPPISRRHFLAGSLAMAGGLLAPRWLRAADAAVDPDRFALLSDTHIDADPATLGRKINVTDHLKQVVGEIVKLDRRPAWALVNGDLALKDGQSKDYVQFLSLMSALREKGMPVHLGLGNHDHRERFWDALGANDPARHTVENRQITVIDAPKAKWILLDSLDETNKTPGVLGEKQLGWLAGALDSAKEKPVLIVVHHDPQMPAPKTAANAGAPSTKPAAAKVPGLTDTKPLMDILVPRKQVKAIFFGHTHVWRNEKVEGIHLVNLPAVAYPFKETEPTGWVDCRLTESGVALELRCTDPAHSKQGQKVELTWRS